MDKKYGEKYSALRAAAAARQRQRGNSGGDNSNSSSRRHNLLPPPSSYSSSLSSTNNAISKMDGDDDADASRQRRQRTQQQQFEKTERAHQLQQQQQHQRHRLQAESNDGNIGGLRGSDHAEYNDHHPPTTTSVPTSANGQQQQQPPLPPRRRPLPPMPNGNGSSSANANVAVAGSIIAPSTPAKTTAAAASSSPSADVYYNYATPGHGVAVDRRNDGTNGDDDLQQQQHQPQQEQPPPMPKTPLTMMRSVRASVRRDRNEIEGARMRPTAAAIGGLFAAEDEGGADDGHRVDERRRGRQQEQQRRHDDVRAQQQQQGWDDDDIDIGGIPHDGDYNRATKGAALDEDILEEEDEDSTDDGFDDLRRQRRGRYLTPSLSLAYGSDVVLRFRSPNVPATLSVRPNGGGGGRSSSSSSSSTRRVCFVANESHARMGGIGHRGENRFVVLRGGERDDATTNDDGGAAVGDDHDEDDVAAMVCYGDKITLRSTVTKRVLGVQKEKIERGGDDDTENGNDDNARFRLEVGCFRREGRFPRGNSWTVLRGGSRAGIVRLGPLSSPAHEAMEDRRGRDAGRRRVPVHSGDPIALRNDWTGGILSLGDECHIEGNEYYDDDDDDVTGWSLNVLTSSYQMNADGAASTEDNVPLIECLQRQDRCRPRRTETFQIVGADAPAIGGPGWTRRTAEGGSQNDRAYLGGTYLEYANRHGEDGEEDDDDDDENDDARLNMFPEVGEEERQRGRRMAGGMPLAELSVDVQEMILTDEIVGAMMGQEGGFLRYRSSEEEEEEEVVGEDERRSEGGYIANEPGFGFASSSVMGGKIDSGLEDVLSRILPLCTNYANVNRYVQMCLNQYETGLIARTLCETINELLEEYLAFVSNLDYLSREGEEPPSLDDVNNGTGQRKQQQRQRLTISMVHVHARPAIRTMAILGQVVSAVQGKKGGELLNALHDLATLNFSGDEKANDLLQHLLSRCAVPYANMLQTWLKHGKVHDPYGEFMIEITNKSFRENNVAASGMATVKQQRRGMEWTNWCRENEDHVLFSLHDSNEDILSMSMTMMMGNDSAALGVDRSRATSNMSSLHKAHATGKYWRAIHCCHDGGGGAESAPWTTQQQQKKKEEEERSSPKDNEQAKVLLNPLKLSRCIDRAYHEASDMLLRMLFVEYDLLSSLRFMKKYFLLDQGDFFVDFLDGAEDELNKELPDVLQGRVQNWLSTSIARTSESSHLAWALRCSFQNKSLRDTLDDIGKRNHHRKSSKKNARQKVLAGFEAIAFEFKAIPFPTSIVLSHNQLRIYTLIFRLIFFAKYVERQLVSMWSDHQLLKAMTLLRAACSTTFSLRRRMLHFIQNFVYYLEFDVIEPHWRELESKLNASKEHFCSDNPKHDDDPLNHQFPRTVDDVVFEHNQFLARISTECLLPNYDLIERASKIMTTCLLFSTQIKRFMETTKVHELHEKTRHERSKLRYANKRSKHDDEETNFRSDREERTQRCSDRIHRELCTETYRHMITRFDEVFSAHLAEFMKNLNSDYGQKSNAHLANLSMQLDYNGFLSSSIPTYQ